MPPVKVTRIHGPGLRALRKMKGWTLDELATEAEMSFSYLGELERGDKVATSDETIAKLAGALRVLPEAIALPACPNCARRAGEAA